MKHPGLVLLAAIVVALFGFGAWRWRDAWMPTAEPPPASARAPLPPTVVQGAAAASAAASQPLVRHPIEAVAGAESGAQTAEPAPATLESALARLFSPDLLATMIQSDDFARRIVATVDNLGREKAPARLWPLQPPAGRFSAQKQGVAQGEAEVLASDNFVRYARHMTLIERADLRQVVALYKRFYPQFQQAYGELGYPGRHFNDRVVEVIDLLLATPEPREPVAVRMPVINGPMQPPRPWLLYEFADPENQSLAAGQQLLLRMGPDNRRRLKVRLAELRRLLAR